jgi:MATE family multidrug resistance protein
MYIGIGFAFVFVGTTRFSYISSILAWVQSIGMAFVPAYAAMLGLVLHVPLNLFFIYVVGWGYLGCAVATVCFQLVQPIFMIIYLFGLARGRRQLIESMGGRAIGRTGLTFWKEFSIAVSSMQGYLQYLGLALPGIIIISEWWASETSIFLSGRLVPYPELALGGEREHIGGFESSYCLGVMLTSLSRHDALSVNQ